MKTKYKTAMLLTIVAVAFAVASELEFRDFENLQAARAQRQYEACMQKGAASVFTDTEALELIIGCETSTGYSANELP